MLRNRAKQITQIIDKRQSLAQEISNIIETLKPLSLQILHIENYQKQFNTNSKIAKYLRDIDLTTSIVQIDKGLEVLRNLQIRFERSTLNIGFVGRVRQGKSTLIQSLSGLELPDINRLHWTWVRTIIFHNSNPNEEAYCKIWFHSESSFLDEVIAPYYEKLHLGSKPINLSDFANNPLPAISSSVANQSILV